jgi:hypothetical protein
MQSQEFRIAYDILSEGYGFAPFFFGVVSIILAVILYFQIVLFFESGILTREPRDFAPIILVPIMMVILIFSAVNIFQIRGECLERLAQGNFSVLEGVVKNLVSRSKRESFSVNNHNFEYSSHDLTECGFNLNSATTIREGMYVRISFANGRILKLEVPK